MRHCGKCHTCGTKLTTVLDGEQWCRVCGMYRRYHTHGWGTWEDTTPCLTNTAAGIDHVSCDIGVGDDNAIHVVVSAVRKETG